MSCGHCNPVSGKETKKQYKCESCGSAADNPGDCCGKSREKVCDCGSGKYAKECCEA